MYDDGCFTDCNVPSDASYAKAFDQQSASSSTQVPSKSSCLATNVSTQQTGGEIAASQDRETPSETILPAYFDQGIPSVFNECWVVFGGDEAIAPSEGQVSLLPLRDEVDTLTRVRSANGTRECGCGLPPSSSSLWGSYPFQTSERVGWTEASPPSARATSSQSSHCAATQSACAPEGAIKNLPRPSIYPFFEDLWVTRGSNSLGCPRQEQHLSEKGHAVTPFLAPVELLKLRGHQPALQCRSANSNSNLLNAVGVAQRETCVEVPEKVTETVKAKTADALPSDEARGKRETEKETLSRAERGCVTEPPRSELEDRMRLRQKCLDPETYFAIRRGAHRASLALVRQRLNGHFTHSKTQ
ncbi:uncharacterized protein Tco025E_07659 [Trypanosoma conorhini]|uniref:Uncharacterized protein n=1 Tax=Trypanosoma conorhini TaxID=83891 RepID=A0A3R7RKR3_9TRYP|nr:uncharacterized protein Tco025E_07659 [Trypanosoma conorhini]RNF06119.1 hypothetical protein Tco025E_07659 [Trypanosoma conorhini]